MSPDCPNDIINFRFEIAVTIKRLVNNLRANKADNHDGIGTSELRFAAAENAQSPAVLFNQSLATGTLRVVSKWLLFAPF